MIVIVFSGSRDCLGVCFTDLHIKQLTECGVIAYLVYTVLWMFSVWFYPFELHRSTPAASIIFDTNNEYVILYSMDQNHKVVPEQRAVVWTKPCNLGEENGSKNGTGAPILHCQRHRHEKRWKCREAQCMEDIRCRMMETEAFRATVADLPFPNHRVADKRIWRW